MTASSVTGVGQGSAFPYNKGSQENTIGVGHLIGIRVVNAGQTTLASGAATVKLASDFGIPYLDAVTGRPNFIVTATDTTAAAAVKVGTFTNDSDGNFYQFAITGTSADVINWLVVKVV